MARGTRFSGFASDAGRASAAVPAFLAIDSFRAGVGAVRTACHRWSTETLTETARACPAIGADSVCAVRSDFSRPAAGAAAAADLGAGARQATVRNRIPQAAQATQPKPTPASGTEFPRQNLDDFREMNAIARLNHHRICADGRN